MTYWDTSRLAIDQDFRARLAACASSEGVVDPHPTVWADEHQWQIAPTFAEQYAYAVEIGVEDPGRDPSVITDDDLRTAVAAILAQGAPPDGR